MKSLTPYQWLPLGVNWRGCSYLLRIPPSSLSVYLRLCFSGSLSLCLCMFVCLCLSHSFSVSYLPSIIPSFRHSCLSLPNISFIPFPVRRCNSSLSASICLVCLVCLSVYLSISVSVIPSLFPTFLSIFFPFVIGSFCLPTSRRNVGNLIRADLSHILYIDMEWLANIYSWFSSVCPPASLWLFPFVCLAVLVRFYDSLDYLRLLVRPKMVFIPTSICICSVSR